MLLREPRLLIVPDRWSTREKKPGGRSNEIEEEKVGGEACLAVWLEVGSSEEKVFF